MCIALGYLDSLHKLLNQITKDFNLLRQKHSDIDRRLSQKYHELETAKLNAYQGWLISNELQIILQERRVIKNELVKLKTLIDSLGGYETTNSTNRARRQVRNLDRKHKQIYTKYKIDIEKIVNEGREICESI